MIQVQWYCKALPGLGTIPSFRPKVPRDADDVLENEKKRLILLQTLIFYDAYLIMVMDVGLHNF